MAKERRGDVANRTPRSRLDDIFPKPDGCCRLCYRPVDPERDFEDDLSRREYSISGICQGCQDRVFADEEVG